MVSIINPYTQIWTGRGHSSKKMQRDITMVEKGAELRRINWQNHPNEYAELNSEGTRANELVPYLYSRTLPGDVCQPVLSISATQTIPHKRQNKYIYFCTSAHPSRKHKTCDWIIKRAFYTETNWCIPKTEAFPAKNASQRHQIEYTHRAPCKNCDTIASN